MINHWRDAIPAAIRRPSFWVTVSLAGNALVWLIIFNHTASLSLSAPQSLFGFRIGHDFSVDLVFLELAGVPLFGLMLVSALFYILVRHQRRRPPTGSCRVCGYDLRASPERCPECGSIGSAA